MNTKRKGNIAELSAAKKLAQQGKPVSFPFGDNERYDIVVEEKEGLKKAQVRKATKRKNYLVFKCYSNHRKQGEIKRETFTSGEIDFFLVWYQELDRLFEIPVEDAPKTEMRLRLEKPQNNQTENVNWAENYEI